MGPTKGHIHPYKGKVEGHNTQKRGTVTTQRQRLEGDGHSQGILGAV